MLGGGRYHNTLNIGLSQYFKFVLLYLSFVIFFLLNSMSVYASNSKTFNASQSYSTKPIIKYNKNKDKEQYKLTINTDDNIKSFSDINGWKDKGSKIIISATARDNDTDYTTENGNYRYKKTYFFDKWSDGNTTNSRKLTMDKVITLSASGMQGKSEEQHKKYLLNCGLSEHTHTDTYGKCYSRCQGNIKTMQKVDEHRNGYECDLCGKRYPVVMQKPSCCERIYFVCTKTQHTHSGSTTTGGGCYTKEVWE